MKPFKFILGLCILFTLKTQAETILERGFISPPDSIRLGTFWYWMSDNISEEGVVQDLYAMKKAGINLAFIGIIGPSTHHNENYPYGKVTFFSEEWWRTLHTALKTATALDIEIGIFNSPGWSQSGGPWIKNSQSMRYLSSNEIHVSGPKKLSIKIPSLCTDFQDVKVIAFQKVRNNLLDTQGSQIFISSGVKRNGKGYQLSDEESSVSLVLPTCKTVRSILIYPGNYLQAQCLFQVKKNGVYQTIKEFSMSRDASLQVANGFDQKSPVAEALPETQGKEFRILLQKVKKGSGISSLILSSSPIVQRFSGKTFAKFEDTGHQPKEPVDKSLFVDSGDVRDISECLSNNGQLNWEVPKGEWTIMRLGMTPTGAFNSPATIEATGLEVDKLNKKHVQFHFSSYLGEIYKRIPPEDRKCWKYTVLDSYEKGGQNITDDFLKIFQQRYGYDPIPYLPTYYGYAVDSYEKSDRFLWDMRRLVADLIAYEYVGGLKEISNRYGLRTWLENYGHGGFSAEFLQYGGQSDEVAGEFWNERHVIEKRAASSCAHIYGKPLVWAESFTNEGRNGSAFQRYPGMLKKYGDLAFATGINSILLHVYIQQYANDDYPGVDAWFGTEFNRKNTWFSQIDMFVQYLKRTSFMLQQGLNVADVAYYIGENTPIMTGSMVPELPQGYNFDFINSEVLIRDLKVVDGRFVLPHGVSYRILVLPRQKRMRPEVLQKLEKLVSEGGTIIGIPPIGSPSLQDYPHCDEKILNLARKMWRLNFSDSQSLEKRIIPYGKGQIFMNTSLEEAFSLLNIMPDCSIKSGIPVLYTHRTLKDKDVEIYFLTNQSDETIYVSPQFRVGHNMQPELWNAVTGAIRILPEFERKKKVISIPLKLEAHESLFVVFKKIHSRTAEKVTQNIPCYETIYTLTTPWIVNFESDSIKRGPKKTIFTQLSDWSQNEDEKIKYFSGVAHYQTEFNLEYIPEGKLFLNLGKVYAMAKVKVNNKEVGGVWTAPYQVNITGTLRKGKNRIEIQVVNTWLNRILGDLNLSEKERKILPHTQPWNGKIALQKSGLLGPVKINKEQ